MTRMYRVKEECRTQNAALDGSHGLTRINALSLPQPSVSSVLTCCGMGNADCRLRSFELSSSRALRAATVSARGRGVCASRVEGSSRARMVRPASAAGWGWGVAHSRAPGRDHIGRVPAPMPEEAAARDAQQGDRDGRAPRFQGRLAATFFIFSAKLPTVG